MSLCYANAVQLPIQDFLLGGRARPVGRGSRPGPIGGMDPPLQLKQVIFDTHNWEMSSGWRIYLFYLQVCDAGVRLEAESSEDACLQVCLAFSDQEPLPTLY